MSTTSVDVALSGPMGDPRAGTLANKSGLPPLLLRHCSSLVASGCSLMDLKSVVEAAQAISREMDFLKALPVVMRILLETAGRTLPSLLETCRDC